MESALLEACTALPGESPPPFAPCEFRIKKATPGWETDRAMALRRAVFCVEQGLFVGDDRDAIDDRAQLLIAATCIAGMSDQIVGTVRIHQAEPGVWRGSRLAVHPAFRQQGHLGATLIRLAVSLAHAEGCNTFLAHVQEQNVPLFERLNWTSQQRVVLHGRPHHLMRADLAAYPPCRDAVSGYVTRSRSVA